MSTGSIVGLMQNSVKEVEVINPPVYNPSKIQYSDLTKGKKGEITLKFLASPINEGVEDADGVEGVEQYFDIVRTNMGSGEKKTITNHKTFPASINDGTVVKAGMKCCMRWMGRQEWLWPIICKLS